jgi:hypothetical protein
MTTERDELAKLLFITDNDRMKDPEGEWLAALPEHLTYVYVMADAALADGYVKSDHTEYALDHKRSDLQFVDDEGELWTDKEDVKDYASEYGDTAPLVKRSVTEWVPA